MIDLSCRYIYARACMVRDVKIQRQEGLHFGMTAAPDTDE